MSKQGGEQQMQPQFRKVILATHPNTSRIGQFSCALYVVATQVAIYT